MVTTQQLNSKWLLLPERLSCGSRWSPHLSTNVYILSYFTLYSGLCGSSHYSRTHYRVIQAVSYLGMKLSKWPKFQKLDIYPLSTLGGRNWAYFCSTGSGLRDTDQFSKLPYLGMKLGKWPKFQKLCIYIFPTPGGRNWAYFCSTGSGFRDTDQFSKLSTWPWHPFYSIAGYPEVTGQFETNGRTLHSS